MTEARFFIDANVPMYAVGADHPMKSPCLTVLEWAAKNPLAAVTDAEVLQEILHRYSSIGRRERAAEVVHLFSQVVPDALPVTKQNVLRAIQYWDRHANLQARDAIHLAVMEDHDVQRIVSADHHFDGVSGITRIDPMQWSLETS